MKKLITLALAVLCFSCHNSNEEIVSQADYQQYLEASPKAQIEAIQTEIEFWEQKLQATPNQYPYLSKLAAAETAKFQATGEITSLLKAATYLETAIEKTQGKQASLYQSLARNYISQHRFKEAYELLLKAQKLGERKIDTEKMLFDVALELGDYKTAEQQLSIIDDESDFDFLIRQAKWLDTKGNLEGAIAKLQLATVKAEELKSETLKSWAYSNIADFYGHAGEIEKSYQHYLKALAINPHDYYSLKGISWIAFSHDHNTSKAKEIIDVVSQNHRAPDYHLLKAEIAEFEQDEEVVQKELKAFKSIATQEEYGDMYNKYLILLEPESTLQIALKEVENRPTPQSYSLLAWVLNEKGDYEKALELAEEKVMNNTEEPEVLYHLAEIYKANKQVEKTEELKTELLGASYELGPIMAQKIASL